MRIVSIENKHVNVQFAPTENQIDVCEHGCDSNFLKTIDEVFDVDYYMSVMGDESKVLVEKDGALFEIQARWESAYADDNLFTCEQEIRLLQGNAPDVKADKLNLLYFISEGDPCYPLDRWDPYVSCNSILNEVDNAYRFEMDRQRTLGRHAVSLRNAIAHKQAADAFVAAFGEFDAYGHMLRFNEQGRLCVVTDAGLTLIEEVRASDSELARMLRPYDLLVACRLWQAINVLPADHPDTPIIVDLFHTGLAFNDHKELSFIVREFAKMGKQVFFIHGEGQCEGIGKLCDRTIDITDYWK